MLIQESELAKVRQHHKGQKIVLTSGTFDLFHIGHLRYLQEVKKYGDVVVALVSGDARVKHRKGPDRPIIPEAERAQIVDAIHLVDYVLIDPGYNTDDYVDPRYAKILADLQPEVYATDGPDTRFFQLKDHSTEMVVVPRIEAGQFGSTSSIIKHIGSLPKTEYPLEDN